MGKTIAPTAKMTRRALTPQILLALIVLGAVLLRLAFTGLAGQSIAGLSNDARSYNSIAHSLLAGGGFIDPESAASGEPYASRPPLTPFLLAALYWLFGDNPSTAWRAFAIIGGLTCLSVYALGRELLGDRVGLIAAALAAFFPMFILVSGLTLTENLAVPLTTLAVLFLCRARASGRARDAALAGAIIGLASLNRSIALVFIPLASSLFFLAPGMIVTRTRVAIIVVVSALIIIAPWTLRNAIEVGDLLLVDDLTPSAIYQGNNPYYLDSKLVVLETGRPGGVIAPGAIIRPAGEGRSEMRNALLRGALDFITANPGAAAHFAAVKALLLWSPYPHPADVGSWLAAAALALVGVIATWPHRGRLLPFYATFAVFTLVHMATLGLPRYRIPFEGLILVLTASGVVSITSRALHVWRKHRPRALLRRARPQSAGG